MWEIKRDRFGIELLNSLNKDERLFIASHPQEGTCPATAKLLKKICDILNKDEHGH